MTDRLDSVGILPRVIEAAIDPRTRLCFYELDRLIDRRLGDTGVNRCLDDLENCAVRGWVIVTLVARDKISLRHNDILKQDGPAKGRALPETGPIVDHRKAGGVAVRDGIPGASFVIESDDGNEMREHSPGGIEFPPVHHDVVPS